MGSKSSQPTAEQKEEVERKEIDHIQEIENVVSNIERVIEGNPNPTLSHLVQLFSNAVSVQKPELHCFKEIVNTMKKNWSKLSKCLDALGVHVNNEDRKEIIALQRDYWGLLLKTRSVIQVLVKKCRIQQRDVRILLDLIKIAEQNNGELSNDEILAHQECVQTLGQWIEIAELQTLYNEWQDVCDRLQKQQMSWKEKVAQLKQNSKHLAVELLKGLGIAVAAAAVISLIIFSVFAATAASYGAAAPVAVAAGGAAVKTVTIFGVSLLAKHAVIIGISLGVLALGGATYGGCKIWQCHDAACQAYKNANRVTTMLAKMIRESRKIIPQIKALDDKEQNVTKELEYLRNTASRIRMKASLRTIDEYLSEYIKQGEDVIKTVDGACKQYIK